MTCVLGMVVRREREIRSFVKTPFLRLLEVHRLTIKHLMLNGECVSRADIMECLICIRIMALRKEKG